jgi:hypothetical protein
MLRSKQLVVGGKEFIAVELGKNRKERHLVEHGGEVGYKAMLGTEVNSDEPNLVW